MDDVTVITPSLPDRAERLAEAMASVAAQTHPVAAHFVGVDYGKRGPAEIRNEIARAVSTEWVAFLDDDDLLDRYFVQVLLAESAHADVVVPWCRFDPPEQAIPPKYHNRMFDRDALRRHGIFPITTIVRTTTFLVAGGFPAHRYEDWALWNVMADMGARFRVVPQILWTYRLGHGDHRTHR